VVIVKVPVQVGPLGVRVYVAVVTVSLGEEVSVLVGVYVPFRVGDGVCDCESDAEPVGVPVKERVNAFDTEWLCDSVAPVCVKVDGVWVDVAVVLCVQVEVVVGLQLSVMSLLKLFDTVKVPEKVNIFVGLSLRVNVGLRDALV